MVIRVERKGPYPLDKAKANVGKESIKLIIFSLFGHTALLLPESCTKYRSEAPKVLCLKRRWSDFDPQAYDPYGEDQNHETSFKGKALQAAVGSWCKIQVLIQANSRHMAWSSPDPSSAISLRTVRAPSVPISAKAPAAAN